MVSAREETPHKHIGNDSCGTCHQNVYQGKTVKSMHLQVDNTTALKYIVKMGEQKSDSNSNSKEDLRISAVEHDHT